MLLFIVSRFVFTHNKMLMNFTVSFVTSCIRNLSLSHVLGFIRDLCAFIAGGRHLNNSILIKIHCIGTNKKH